MVQKWVKSDSQLSFGLIRGCTFVITMIAGPDILQLKKSGFVWFPKAVTGIMEWSHNNLIKKKAT